MTHRNLSIATIYSSAQCVLSVVGSVGVILLFAGIPQLIYSPSVSAANLLTFVMGAVLIMTMVAGNSFLNYKYRAMDRANRQDAGQGESGAGSAGTSNSDDKPPSYESVLTLDGLPPEYASIVAAQKPPRYEEIVKETDAACGSPDAAPASDACQTQPQAAPQSPVASSPSPRQNRIVVTLNKVEEEEGVETESTNESDRRDVLETTARNAESEDTAPDTDQQASQPPAAEAQASVASDAANCLDQQAYGESET